MNGPAGELRELVARQLGLYDAGLDDRLIEDLGAGSVDIVTIVAIAEEAYGVRIDEEQLPLLRTVRDLAEEVSRLLGEG
jgi:acyl carrier protein